ncbi:MAG: carbohydrate ABC transporter permease, partial [Halapricum sp.]
MSIDANDHEDAETPDDQDEESKNRVQAWASDWIEHPQKAYVLLLVFLGGVLLTTSLFPLYWLFAVAMAQPGQTDIALIPTRIDLSAFVVIFQRVPFARYMFNSLFYAVSVTVIVLLAARLAGYAF